MTSMNHTGIRAKFLRDYPFQATWEELASSHSEVRGDDMVEITMFCLLEDLRLAWAGARAVFGEQATPDLAWQILIRTEEDCRLLEQGANHE